METFFGRMKNEMFYGHEKSIPLFETFAKAVDSYINYYNNERIKENKMDASYKIQRGIHVPLIQFFMCQNSGHISEILTPLFTYTYQFNL